MIRRSQYVMALTALLILGLLGSGIIPSTDVTSASIQASGLKSWMTVEDSSGTETTIKVPSDHLNWTKVATMIETRDSPMLIPILQSWLALVPPDWPFVVWTGRENHDMLVQATCFKDDIVSGRLNFTRIDGADSPYRPDPKLTSTLSDVLANSNWFWTQFKSEAEWMLFFQVDSVLCSKSGQSVDDWLGYDFVGGPSLWSHGPGQDRLGGNGGLSMRRISALRDITTRNPRKPDEDPEDVWFTRRLKDIEGSRFPEPEGRSTAAFSMSQGWLEDNKSEEAWKPLGVHHGSMHMGEALEPNAGGSISDYQHRIIQSCPEFLFLRYAIDEFQGLDAAGQKLGNQVANTDEAKVDGIVGMTELTSTIESLQEMVRHLMNADQAAGRHVTD